MRIRVNELRHLVSGIVTEAVGLSILKEADGHFEVGSIVPLLRDVRVTMMPSGKWKDPQVAEFEGGEDSPGARRPSRPKGSTVAILTPGTRCKVLKATKNWVYCKPFNPDGSGVVHHEHGVRIPVDKVIIHVNKFDQTAADTYKAGKKGRAAGAADTKSSEIARLKALLASAGIETDEEGSWDDKTPIDTAEPDFR